jgi:hypothetical protein
MSDTLNRAELEALTVNGLDVVLLMLHVTVELAAAISRTSKEADNRLIDVANRLDTTARGLTEPRIKLLVEQVARALITTESAP